MPPLSSCTNGPTTAQTSTTEKMFDAEVVRDDCDLVVEDETTSRTTDSSNVNEKEPAPPMKIVWRNVILFAYLHLASVYGAYLMCTASMWQTNCFATFLYLISGVGVTAGAHRLWAHRSYKARLPLRILLAFIYTIAFENDIYEWARDHRVHHKYSETDADPHNATRGFFFAHIGWLLCRKHPDVIKKGKAIDTSDLLADPVVRFHRRFYLPLVLLCCFVLPTWVPMYFWGESFMNAFFVATLFRFCFTLNQTWLVNSAAHMWGQRPYDVHINPRQNLLVAFGAVGEGFHNYHHTFPYDYATSEYGIKYNLTTLFIDTMAKIGLAYDRKTASQKVITARKLRTGVDRPQKVTGDNGESADVQSGAAVIQETSMVQNGIDVVQNGVDVVQNQVMETSKMVMNGVSALSKAVQEGVNDYLKTSSVTNQDSVLETSMIVLNGVAKVVRNGVNDILKTTSDEDAAVVGVLQTSGVHKRGQGVAVAQNGVGQSPVVVANNGPQKKED